MDEYESFTKLRIDNRLVPRDRWDVMMKNKKYVPFDMIAAMTKAKKPTREEVVFIGVLYDKSQTKRAANGNHYGVWNFTSLSMGASPVELSLQLYDDAYRIWDRELEKSKQASRGSIFAILNAKVLPPREGGKGMGQKLTCTINLALQLNKLGTSPNLGFCKQRKESDDKLCNRPINKDKSLFGLCHFHQARQLSRGGGNKIIQSAIRTTDATSIGKTVFQKQDIAHDPTSAMYKNLEAMKSLSKPVGPQMMQQQKQKMKEAQRQAEMKKVTTWGAHLARHSNSSTLDNKVAAMAALSKKSVITSAASIQPLCGRGMETTKEGTAELLFNTSHSFNGQSNLKKRALPDASSLPLLAAPDPNNPMATKRRMREQFGTANSREKKLTVDLKAEDKKDMEEEAKELQNKKTVMSQEEQRKKLELLYGKDQGKKMLLTAQEKENLRNAKSKNSDLVIMEQLNERDRVRDVLETRDEFDNEKAKIMFLEVKAWHCHTCKATTDVIRAKMACEESNHPVTQKMVKKTRWECRKCFQSSYVLDRAMPTACNHCKGDTFRHVHFFKLKTAAMEKHMLEMRGADHDRYLDMKTKQRSMEGGSGEDAYAALDRY